MSVPSATPRLLVSVPHLSSAVGRSAYRPEIDGLRALAVLPVLLYHADIPGFSGGYIGVDVFFVISGYLISRIIIAAIDGDGFSYAQFYERRARRILPALFFTLAWCIPVAWWILGPPEFEAMSRAMDATLFFSSNIYFWQHSGYFAPDADLSPLLHTWSLAVEEQFYFIFPTFLVLCWRRLRGAVPVVLVVLGLASLILAQAATQLFPGAGFYLLPSRGWELVAGVWLAVAESRRGEPDATRPTDERWAPILTAAGILAIAIATTTFDAATPHPGLLTVLPVAGTMLVVRYGRVDGLARRVLIAPPVVAIGLISYSLYLVHHPLLAFARVRFVGEPPLTVRLILLAAAFVLAWCSYHVVERPFRNRKTTSTRWVVSVLGATATLLLAVGLTATRADGFPGRFDERVLAAYRVSGQNAARLFERDGERCHDRAPDRACLLGDTLVSPTWALLGDSHASTLAAAMDEALAARGAAALHFGRSGCPFVKDMEVVTANGQMRCPEANARIRELLMDPGIEIVVVAARYGAYLHAGGLDNGMGGVDDEVIRMEPMSGPFDEAHRRRAVLDAFVESVHWLLAQGKRVILVYPVPEHGWDVPSLVVGRRLAGVDGPLVLPLSIHAARHAEIDSAFDAIGNLPGLRRVRPTDIFCDTASCAAERGDHVLYSDPDHLSFDGAAVLFQAIITATDNSTP